MSTCNFGTPTLKYNYTIGMTDDFDFDLDYDYTIENIQEALTIIKDFDSRTYSEWIKDKKIIGNIPLEVYNKEYKEWDSPHIYIVVEGGYFQGASIDVDIDEFDGYELNKTTQKKLESYLNRIEKILFKNTLPIKRVAVFSNGEGVYEEVKKLIN